MFVACGAGTIKFCGATGGWSDHWIVDGRRIDSLKIVGVARPSLLLPPTLNWSSCSSLKPTEGLARGDKGTARTEPPRAVDAAADTENLLVFDAWPSAVRPAPPTAKLLGRRKIDGGRGEVGVRPGVANDEYSCGVDGCGSVV